MDSVSDLIKLILGFPLLPMTLYAYLPGYYYLFSGLDPVSTMDSQRLYGVPAVFLEVWNVKEKSYFTLIKSSNSTARDTVSSIQII